MIKAKKNIIEKFPTDCCALCQLSLNDFHTKEEIKRALNRLSKESRSRSWAFTGKAYGQKAVFVITTPDENILANNLKELGFKPVFEFERREGYPKTGLLTMWCFNL